MNGAQMIAVMNKCHVVLSRIVDGDNALMNRTV